MTAKLRVLIVALASAAALMGVVPAAAIAAAPPTVNWAHGSQDDPGIVEVYASAEAGIEGLTAHIRSMTSGEEVATVTSFSLSSGTVHEGVYTADSRVQLDKFGIYRIDVDAIDTLGQRTSLQSAGSLVYVIQPSFSALSFDHTTITYSRRTVKVKGTLSGKWPTDGLVRPISGQPVEILSLFGPSVGVQTGSDGRFTGTVTLNKADDISAYFNIRSNDYGFAESESQHISVQPLRTRIAVKVTPGQVKAGEPVTISGQLTWNSPDGWQPLANRPFGLSECDEFEYCWGAVDDQPVTDAEGRFSITAVPHVTGYYQVGFSGKDENGQPDPFLPPVTSRAPVSVLQPAQFSDFTAARNESGQVVASGHLNFSNYTPGTIPVQIQYRASGTTSSWVTLATIENADWDGSGYGFSATVDQPAGGQWRAYYAGQARWFETAVSTKVLVSAAT
ncbi:hypothetical protein [Kribbella monticola]|uniref:hypothetical protein n=1 Tax=Kribbella monticola TaxID=2185285 RepID=UPI001300189E|nr:hypothetical protein [Kribbella monticola]